MHSSVDRYNVGWATALIAFGIATITHLPAYAVVDSDGSVGRIPTQDRQLLSKALDANLYDADTARIRDFRIDANRLGCGFVNAKNLQGGYTGYRLFAFDLKADLFVTAKRSGVGAIGDGEQIDDLTICRDLLPEYFPKR